MTSIKKSKAILAALICNGFWGLSFMASRTAMKEAPVFLVLSHRFVLAFLVMTLLCFTSLGKGSFRGKPLLPLVLLGLFQPVLYYLGELYGILHSSTIFSGVMIALIPIVATIAAMPILGEKLSIWQFLFSLLSVGGVVGIGLLTGSSGSLDWIGIVGLLAAVFSAVAYLLLSRGISKRYTPFERAYSMICVGTPVFTEMAFISIKGDVMVYLQPLSKRSYLFSILFLGVCCSVICFLLSSYVITGLSVAQAAIFANLTTAVSVFAGAVFLHEPFSFPGMVCCFLILLGIYGVNAAGSGSEG